MADNYILPKCITTLALRSIFAMRVPLTYELVLYFRLGTPNFPYKYVDDADSDDNTDTAATSDAAAEDDGNFIDDDINDDEDEDVTDAPGAFPADPHHRLRHSHSGCRRLLQAILHFTAVDEDNRLQLS